MEASQCFGAGSWPTSIARELRKRQDADGPAGGANNRRGLAAVKLGAGWGGRGEAITIRSRNAMNDAALQHPTPQKLRPGPRQLPNAIAGEAHMLKWAPASGSPRPAGGVRSKTKAPREAGQK
jgi:hypothetical protein